MRTEGEQTKQSTQIIQEGKNNTREVSFTFLLPEDSVLSVRSFLAAAEPDDVFCLVTAWVLPFRRRKKR